MSGPSVQFDVGTQKLYDSCSRTNIRRSPACLKYILRTRLHCPTFIALP
jgi:hypothetical protein